MLKIIENGSEIRRAQDQLKKALEPYWDETFSGTVGHMGRSWKTTIRYSKELGIWSAMEIEQNRYWNGFGLGEPEKKSSNSIVAEINPPRKGIQRGVAGAFAKDERGNIILCHRGNIRGGKPGVGKTLFMSNYRNQFVAMGDGGRETEVALIGDLKSPRLGHQVREFVLEVSRIKKLAEKPSAAPIIPKLQKGFSPEFAGKKRATIRKDITFNCDHGYVVGELARLLEARNLTIGNDRNRDLYILGKQGNILTLFEVKTDIETGSLYSGVGQLIINSFQMETRPRLILTIPEQLPSNIEEGLKNIGVKCLTYKLAGKDVNFKNLKELKLFEQGNKK
jgi:hypothetical protein